MRLTWNLLGVFSSILLSALGAVVVTIPQTVWEWGFVASGILFLVFLGLELASLLLLAKVIAVYHCYTFQELCEAQVLPTVMLGRGRQLLSGKIPGIVMAVIIVLATLAAGVFYVVLFRQCWDVMMAVAVPHVHWWFSGRYVCLLMVATLVLMQMFSFSRHRLLINALSWIGIVTALGIGAAVVYAFVRYDHQGNALFRAWPEWKQLPSAFPIVVFAYYNQPYFAQFLEHADDPRTWRWLAISTTVICGVIFMLFGSLGAITFGATINANIITNLRSNDPVTAVAAGALLLTATCTLYLRVQVIERQARFDAVADFFIIHVLKRIFTSIDYDPSAKAPATDADSAAGRLQPHRVPTPPAVVAELSGGMLGLSRRSGLAYSRDSLPPYVLQQSESGNVLARTQDAINLNGSPPGSMLGAAARTSGSKVLAASNTTVMSTSSTITTTATSTTPPIAAAAAMPTLLAPVAVRYPPASRRRGSVGSAGSALAVVGSGTPAAATTVGSELISTSAKPGGAGNQDLVATANSPAGSSLLARPDDLPPAASPSPPSTLPQSGPSPVAATSAASTLDSTAAAAAAAPASKPPSPTPPTQSPSPSPSAAGATPDGSKPPIQPRRPRPLLVHRASTVYLVSPVAPRERPLQRVARIVLLLLLGAFFCLMEFFGVEIRSVLYLRGAVLSLLFAFPAYAYLTKMPSAQRTLFWVVLAWTLLLLVAVLCVAASFLAFAFQYVPHL